MKLHSKYMNIQQLFNKKKKKYYYKVKVTHNNKSYGQDKMFEDELKAVEFRNELWKQYKPFLYEKEFEEKKEEVIVVDIDKVDFVIPNPVPEFVKKVIIRMQDMKCPICKKEINISDDFQLDHIYPTGKGGIHKKINFQILHTSCHITKTNIIIDKNIDINKTIFDNNSLTIEEKIEKIKLVQEKW